MKYHVLRIWVFARFILMGLFVCSGYLVLHTPDIFGIEVGHKLTDMIVLLGFYVFYLVKYMPEHLNRYVELNHTAFYCNSFRLLMVRNPVSYHFKYEEIYKLEKKAVGLAVYEKSLNRPITIWFSFKKHRELQSIICRRVKQANPNVEMNQAAIKLLINHTIRDG